MLHCHVDEGKIYLERKYRSFDTHTHAWPQLKGRNTSLVGIYPSIVSSVEDELIISQSLLVIGEQIPRIS
jgi:hypothetical protein